MVARLDEISPDFYESWFLIEGCDMLETYMQTHGNIRKEGTIYIADALSDADVKWLDVHSIRYELVNSDIVT